MKLVQIGDAIEDSLRLSSSHFANQFLVPKKRIDEVLYYV